MRHEKISEKFLVPKKSQNDFSRTAKIVRNTNETQIILSLNLDKDNDITNFVISRYVSFNTILLAI